MSVLKIIEKSYGPIFKRKILLAPHISADPNPGQKEKLNHNFVE